MPSLPTRPHMMSRSPGGPFPVGRLAADLAGMTPTAVTNTRHLPMKPMKQHLAERGGDAALLPCRERPRSHRPEAAGVQPGLQRPGVVAVADVNP
jgi:hypothetical protein